MTPAPITWRVVILLFLLGSAVGFAVAGGASLAPRDDAAQYLSIAEHVAHGLGFSYEGAPTMIREPMYPALIAAIFRITGDSRFAVLIFQSFLLGAIAAGTFTLASRTLPSRWAIAVGAAVIPMIAAYAGLFLSEMLAACYVLASAHALSAADRRPTAWNFAVAGALLGGAALTKSVALFFVPLAIIAIVVRGRSDFRGAVARAALFSAAFIIIVSPWMLRNQERFGVTQIASRGGMVLYVRANRTELSPHDRHLLMAQAILGERLTAKFSPDILDKRQLLDGSEAMSKASVSMNASGMTDADIDKSLGRQAVATILRHPFAYATDTIQEFFLFNMLALPVVDMRALFTSGHPALPEVVKDLIVVILRLVNFAWIALAGYGVWTSRKEPALFWPTCLLAYWNLIHMAVDAIPRYSVSVMPIYMVFAATAALRLLERVRLRRLVSGH